MSSESNILTLNPNQSSLYTSPVNQYVSAPTPTPVLTPAIPSPQLAPNLQLSYVHSPDYVQSFRPQSYSPAPAAQNVVLPQQPQQPVWATPSGFLSGQYGTLPGVQFNSFPGAYFSADTNQAPAAAEAVAPATVAEQITAPVTDLSTSVVDEGAATAFRLDAQPPLSAAPEAGVSLTKPAATPEEAPALEVTGLGNILDRMEGGREPLTAETYARKDEYIDLKSRLDPTAALELAKLGAETEHSDEARAAADEIRARQRADAERGLGAYIAQLNQAAADLDAIGISGFDPQSPDLGADAIMQSLRKLPTVSTGDYRTVRAGISTAMNTLRTAGANFGDVTDAVTALNDAVSSTLDITAHAALDRQIRDGEISLDTPLARDTNPRAMSNQAAQVDAAERYESADAKLERIGIPESHESRQGLQARARFHRTAAETARERTQYLLDPAEVQKATVDSLMDANPGAHRPTLERLVRSSPGILALIEGHNLKVGDHDGIKEADLIQSVALVRSSARGELEALASNVSRSQGPFRRGTALEMGWDWGAVMAAGGLALALYEPFERRSEARRAERRADRRYDEDWERQQELLRQQNEYALQRIEAQGEASGGGSVAAVRPARF